MSVLIYFLRLFGMGLWFIFSFSVYGVALFWRWGDISLNHRVSRLLSWGLTRIAGWQIEITGSENLTATRPCVYVANHQSGWILLFLDIFIRTKRW